MLQMPTPLVSSYLTEILPLQKAIPAVGVVVGGGRTELIVKLDVATRGSIKESRYMRTLGRRRATANSR